jgi:hypothetical protein
MDTGLSKGYWEKFRKAGDDYETLNESDRFKLWKNAMDSLKSKAEVLKFDKQQEDKATAQLEQFNATRSNPQTPDILGNFQLAVILKDVRDLEEWDNWGRRQDIIGSAIQATRKFCMSKGNSKDQCICALETNKGSGLMGLACLRYYREFTQKQ